MEKSTHTSEYQLLRRELLRFRTEANLSQRALAARLEVPHSWVAKVEAGERRIDVVELCWFLAACEVDPATSLAFLVRQLKGKPATLSRASGERGEGVQKHSRNPAHTRKR